MDTPKLKKLLLEKELLTKDQFKRVEKEAKERGISIKKYLPETGLVSDQKLGKVIADYYGVDYVYLENEVIDEEVIKIIPEIVAKSQKIIVFDRDEEGIKLAMCNPDNLEMINWIERKTGEKVTPFYATVLDVNNAMRFYEKELKEAFNDIIEAEAKKAKKTNEESESLPIIKIVDTILEHAYNNRASDIHIEPLKEKTKVRFRIDGILHKVIEIPKELHDLIVTRIKVLSELRTDKHSAAQDGEFETEINNKQVDIRVSILPVTEGEKVVLRLLSEQTRRHNLRNLGLSDHNFERLTKNIKEPHGMILATGPTGSGKTTTLYSILKILNTPKVNITTIEDPVEYDVQDVSQIQVNNETGLTFAKGLRSIVRQDPDIIMVGEIRDEETASIAINSAMTGHLVLSTMHANTAATNLPRLMEMGIEPFLVASSVNMIIAQRLVRTICTKCKTEKAIKKTEFENYDFSKEIINNFFDKNKKGKVFYGEGCKVCAGTGYSGRTGIFEIMEITDGIRKLIVQKADADKINNQAIKEGMVTIIEDGIDKIKKGITTLEEVVRVTNRQ